MFISKAFLSKMFITAGSICIVAAAVYEAVNYPWYSMGDASINETELSDPEPPDVSFITYTDLVEDIEPIADVAEVKPESFVPRFTGRDVALPSKDTADEPTEEENILPGEVIEAENKPEVISDRYVLLGNVKIPRLNISENLFEGTENQMKYGVGHLEGTAMPGERGNTVIAAHRASSSGRYPFRHLDKLQNGDIVAVAFNGEVFTYEVFDMFIVPKEDLWVLDKDVDEPYLLTMITCDPVIYPTKRPDRLIIKARRIVEVETKEEQNDEGGEGTQESVDDSEAEDSSLDIESNE